MSPPWPTGFGLALAPGVRFLDGRTTLVGGHPTRVVRLSTTGRDLVERWAAGEAVAASPAAGELARRLVEGGLAHPVPGSPQGSPARDDPRLADVTLVIPVRDRPEGLSRTLASAGPTGATVVVDDGSSPAAAAATAAAAAGRPATTLVSHPAPRGPAAARNTGSRKATTSVVAFLDADCEPSPGWLPTLLGHLADPGVGAVAPRVVTRQPPAARASRLAAYEALRSPLDLGTAPAAVRPGSPVAYVPSAALLVRREALAAVGGFDETLRVGEDVDLVWRLRRAGWSVRYEPGALVGHPPRPHLGAWLTQRWRYGTSAAPLTRRHPGALAPAALSPWSGAAWALAAAGHPLAGAGLAAAGAVRLGRRLRSLDHPWREAARLAGAGHLGAGEQLARCLTRAWWPAAATTAALSRRSRLPLAVAALAPPLADWARRHPPLPLPAWAALCLLDDLAYGAGLWAGCMASGSPAALLPAGAGRRGGAG